MFGGVPDLMPPPPLKSLVEEQHDGNLTQGAAHGSGQGAGQSTGQDSRYPEL